MKPGAHSNSEEPRPPRESQEPNGFLDRLKPKRRATRILLWVLLVVVVVALGVGGWALNRYVIDHVEISDVSSYQSQIDVQNPTVPLATFPPDNPTSPTSTDP
jgi:cytoskeletal protein RodZ